MMMICIIRYVNNDINLQNPIHLYTRKEKTIIKLSDFIWGKKKKMVAIMDWNDAEGGANWSIKKTQSNFQNYQTDILG